MASEDSSRRLLYASAAAALGTEAADVLMQHLPPAGWADLARRADVEHETGLLRADLAAVRAEMAGEFAAVRAEMAGEFAAVRAEMAGEFAAVRAQMAGEFAAVRAELRGEIHSAVASQTRWMVTVLVVLGALYTTVNVLAQ